MNGENIKGLANTQNMYKPFILFYFTNDDIYEIIGRHSRRKGIMRAHILTLKLNAKWMRRTPSLKSIYVNNRIDIILPL